MEILETLAKRRSFRALNPLSPVSRDTLTSCVSAAHLAPSYANKQGWRWIIVDEDPSLSQLKTSLAEGNYWALKAPAFAALVTSETWTPTVDGNRAYAAFGAGLSAMAFMLQATHEGLIAHPMAGFQQDQAKTALGVPAELTLILLISLGYPGEASELKDHHLSYEKGDRIRMPLEKITAWNTWSPELFPDS